MGVFWPDRVIEQESYLNVGVDDGALKNEEAE